MLHIHLHPLNMHARLQPGQKLQYGTLPVVLRSNLTIHSEEHPNNPQQSNY
jgi:hypothetical protein